MSRPVFWASDGAYVLDFEGHPRANAPVRIWSAQTGGTQVTDLQRVDASGAPTAAVPSGVLFSDANGLIPSFAGPDGGATTLWGDHGFSGARLALSADPVASSGGGAVSSVAGRTGAVVLGESDITGLTGDLAAKAPLASPALTGVPTVPTAAQDTSTAQAASTAFVVGQASSATPAMDGTAAIGTSVRHARADHVHPSDTSRLASGAAAGGDLSGTFPSPTVAKVNGVAISGTPSSGQVITATSTTAATWSTPAAGAGDATTSAKGVVQLAGDLAGTATAPVVSRVNGVAVTGTPTSGQVPTATSGSAATWQTPASAPVTSVAGRTGAVTLGESDVTNLTSDLAAKAPLASPALTGTPTAPTASASTNTTQVATTAYADSATAVERVRALAAEALLAPLASPALTGAPTAPTASGGTNTTQVATTAFVGGEIAAKAPLASPALTGTPTVPTAAVDTSTTQAASTAFVVAQAASATPLIDGTAAVGTSTRFARGDHKHPTDTTRAAAATTITAGTGLTGGGDLSANRTLAVTYGTTSTTATVGNDSRVVNAVQSTTITTIVKLTQAAYDALGSPDAATLYVVVG